MSIVERPKRSAGMVLGDFAAVLGIIAFMTGSQSLGGVLFIIGMSVYATTAAAIWAVAQLARLWRHTPR
jgi:hypothetical protein